LTVDVNPAPQGTAVTFTASVAAQPDHGLPVGFVTFSSIDPVTQNHTAIATAPLVNGTATWTTSTLPVGVDGIYAESSGDRTYDSEWATYYEEIDAVAPTPVVGAITPNRGPAAGGTTVTITGQNQDLGRHDPCRELLVRVEHDLHRGDPRRFGSRAHPGDEPRRPERGDPGRRLPLLGAEAVTRRSSSASQRVAAPAAARFRAIRICSDDGPRRDNNGRHGRPRRAAASIVRSREHARSATLEPTDASPGAGADRSRGRARSRAADAGLAHLVTRRKGSG
jgi:hypothetical protein